ncbi:MAG: helix-turn-helix transcriptional regulator [Sedimentisphaerales bacterium]|nr:helix-turn-helix transcriptional regulator [Sedimentisphaerales bacterium]
MSNIASVLKSEISRIARRDIRIATLSFKKSSSQYRRDIAELKRRLSNLQGRISMLEKQIHREAPSKAAETAEKGVRFTAKGLRSQRKRLGLSAADYGKLVGVGAQTIYNWENGISRPRRKQLPVLAALRRIGKKNAHARLEKRNKSRR